MSFFRRFIHTTYGKTFAIGASSAGVISSMSLAFLSKQHEPHKKQIANVHTHEKQSQKVEYSLNDVAMHNSVENRMWVSFKNGVYDITDYLQKHVGGPKYIELVAGGRLESFWSSFNFHLNDSDIQHLLEQYRIGDLRMSDQIALNDDNLQQFEFGNEPFEERPYDKLIVMRDNPFLSEAKNELLGDSFITENELFYTRNHFPVPIALNEANYKLDLHLNIGTNIDFTEMNDKWDDVNCDASLSLNDIKNKYENVELIAALQCSGNRGYALRDPLGLKHTLCQNGFISNAHWKGVRIRDILIDNGYDANDKKFDKYKYITFYAYDTDVSTLHYAMSTPIAHIMNKSNDCLLAFEMNGKPLPKDHGYPLRVLFPGIAGCRSVKWLAKMQLTESEVNSPWQKVSYKPFKYKLYDMPITSVITRPMDGDKLKQSDDNIVSVKGFAWSGGGRGIVRVQLSVDGGDNWKVCELQQTEQERNRAWSWTLWNVDIDAKDIKRDRNGKCSIVCRATDSSFNSQPKDVKDVLNGTMYVNNSWHSVNVQI